MDLTYWHKQIGDQPLFPELLWSRPESKIHAGKLLIIGGNAHSFAAPAEAYQQGLRAGAGAARVLLPDSLRKTVGKVFAAGEFAPSTPSGSFARKALAEFLDQGSWADGVILAGDFGHNSETAILLENFAQKYAGQLTITQDAADYFVATPGNLINRPATTLVLEMRQLQKLAIAVRSATPITSTMDLLKLVEALHDLSQNHPVNITTSHRQNIFVAAAGQVSSTQLVADAKINPIKIAASASVWWLQNPAQTFESLTTAMHASTNPVP